MELHKVESEKMKQTNYEMNNVATASTSENEYRDGLRWTVAIIWVRGILTEIKEALKKTGEWNMKKNGWNIKKKL